MENISLPKKINFKDGDKPNQSLAIIEPCYPGYGMTIGNSLRRVLLSSLPGAAVVGVKIKGANHEFMTIPHIKEDVLELVLNLKQLRIKVFSDEEVKLELDVHSKKEVKASDISKNSKVEIINKDLHIAEITDMAGNLNLEIYVSRGRGYRPVESIEEKRDDIGFIEIDSIFSPVKFVSINIENVRVGKMTNWDKLILNIMTDGTITPEEAFNQAVNILIDQFSALNNNNEAEASVDAGGEKATDKEEPTEEENVEQAAEAKKIKIEKIEEAVPEILESEDKPAKKKRGRPRKNAG
ncbi:MAG: DNA-directed RNA polymerase subunit alpha [Patescibacteria group bacterium]